jgi:hypothetical protein
MARHLVPEILPLSPVIKSVGSKLGCDLDQLTNRKIINTAIMVMEILDAVIIL